MKVAFLAIIAIMSLASGFADLRMRAYPTRSYAEFIPAVVNGTADAPERYRVLVPFTAHALALATGWPPAAVWHLTRLVLFFGAYLVFFHYLNTWFQPFVSLLGTAVVAATLPLTFTNSWAHPDHIAELLLFTAAALAMARQWTLAAVILVGLATLNRETAVFLIPLYLLTGALTRGRLLVTALLGAEWIVIYLGLRLWRGFAHYDYVQVWRNLDFLRLLPPDYDPYYRAYAYFALLLFGGLIAVALRAPGEGRPRFATGALWVIPLFAGVAFLISSIIETRIFTPLYTLAMPAVMFACSTAEITASAAIAPDDHA
jgi:hypothetical protein